MATPVELLALREKIDAIDAQIVSLLGERFAHTAEVGTLKSRLQLPARDPARETEQFARIAELALQHGIEPALAERLFREVMSHVVVQHQLAGAPNGAT